MAGNASSGSSSSPIRRSSGHSTCFISPVCSSPSTRFRCCISRSPPIRDPRPHLFFGQTTSLCETCLDLVSAKILIEGDEVYYQKRCSLHGVQKTLVSTDAAYFRRTRDYLKPGDKPLQFQSRTHFGCPYDCGLCPDHEQHSCLALIELNDACNM